MRRHSQRFDHSVDFQSFRNKLSSRLFASKSKQFINRFDQSLFVSKTEDFAFAIDINKEKRFKTSNVDYFDSHLNDRYGEDDVIISGEKTIYRDVYLFIEAVKFIVMMMKYQATRIRLHRCLHDTVQI